MYYLLPAGLKRQCLIKRCASHNSLRKYTAVDCFHLQYFVKRWYVRDRREEGKEGGREGARALPPSLPPSLLQFPVRAASVSVCESECVCMDVSAAVTLQLPSGVERAHRGKRAHLTPPSAGLRLISSFDATEEPRRRRSGEPWRDRVHSSSSSSSSSSLCCRSPGPTGPLSVSRQPRLRTASTLSVRRV